MQIQAARITHTLRVEVWSPAVFLGHVRIARVLDLVREGMVLRAARLRVVRVALLLEGVGRVLQLMEGAVVMEEEVVDVVDVEGEFTILVVFTVK